MFNLKIGAENIEGQVSLLEKAQELGLDKVRVEKLPQPVIYRGEQYDVGDYKLAYTGATWKSNGVEFINRTIARYEPLQNSDMVEIFDPLSQKYHLDSLGMIGGRGEVFFVQFNMPDFYIGRDRHESKFLVADHREGGGFYVGHTTKRVFCANQFINEFDGIQPIAHSADTKAVMEFLMMIEQKMIAGREQEIAILNRMFTTKVEKGTVNELAQQVFPDPKKSKKLTLFEEGMKKYDVELNEQQQEIFDKQTYVYENSVDRVERRRQFLADEFFRYADEVQGETVYALWNATTDMTSNSDLYRGGDNQFYQTMYGERAKTNKLAWDFCKDLVGVR